MKSKSTGELLKMRASWLAQVNKVTGATGALIVKRLSELEAELERRGYITVIKGRGFNLGNLGRLEGPGFSFELFPSAEAGRDRVSGFNEACTAHKCEQDIIMTWAVLRNGGTLGFINASLRDKRLLMGAEVVPFDLCRIY